MCGDIFDIVCVLSSIVCVCDLSYQASNVLRCPSSIVRVLHNSGRLFLRKGPAPIGEGGGARAGGPLVEGPSPAVPLWVPVSNL